MHLLIYPDIIYAASIVNQNENWLLKNHIYPDIIYAPLDQNCCFQEGEEEEEEEGIARRDVDHHKHQQL